MSPRVRRALLLALPVVAAFGLSIFELHNDDAGFHIATGRYIRDTGTIPSFNPFSYAEDGAVWIQHQWLPAIGMSLLVDAFGPKGLVLAKAALVAAIFGVLAWLFGRLRLGGGVGALLLAVAVAAGANRFYERPYLLSLIALAATTSALLLWRRGAGHRAAWAATLIPAFAVHLHAGALDSLLVWTALLGGLLAERLLPGWGPRGGDDPVRAPIPLRRALAHLGALAALLVLGVALLAPSGLALLTLPVRFSASTYWHEHLVEFRPLPFDRAVTLQWVAVAAGLGTLALAVARRRLFEAFLVGGFVLLGLRHLRMIWPMATVVAAAAGALLADAPPRALGRPAARWGAPVVAAALLLVAWTEQSARFRMGLGEGGVDRRHHALRLVELAGTLPGRAFVSDGLAGTWLWRNYRAVGSDGPLPPEDQHRVLVHNCLECYEESTYIDLYQAIRYGEPGWDTHLDALGVRTLLLKHTSPGERRLQGGRPNLRQHVFADPRWMLVDFDDTAAVWTLRSPGMEPAETLDGFPVDPDTGRPAAGAPWSKVRAALQAHAATHPADTRAARILLSLARHTGDVATEAEATRVVLERAPDSPDAEALLTRLRTLAAPPR